MIIECDMVLRIRIEKDHRENCGANRYCIPVSIFLAEVSERHPEELILMFMGQAGWHKAKRLVIPNNIKLLNLPPYSPELNPAEHLWGEIRENGFPTSSSKASPL